MPHDTPIELKIVIAGGFGAGKTTLVGAVSEIPPLSTEEILTTASTGTDHLTGVEGKTSTTVAMDFGRITLDTPDQRVVLMLFGTPGQARFRSLWPDLAEGALGAVVLADTRRLADSWPVIDFFEQRRTPFVIAVNQFDGATHGYTPDEVRTALQLPDEVPVIHCDARRRPSAADVLTGLVGHALSLAQSNSRQLAAQSPGVPS